MRTHDEAARRIHDRLEQRNDVMAGMDLFDINDVRALLVGYEATRPRVLTLREVQCYQDCPVLWLEHKMGSPSNGKWMDANKIINEYAHPDSRLSIRYGIQWRCWTRRPTMMQSLQTQWKCGPDPGGEK